MKLLDYLKKNAGEEFVVLLHSLADADALGSAVGLRVVLKKARIASSDVLSSSAKKIAQTTGVKIEKIAELKRQKAKKQKIILVDANSRAMLGEAAKAIVFDAVVDHHSKHSDCVEAGNFFVDEKASSASEIVFEALRELKARVDGKTATCLLAGIIADSAEFKNAREKTFLYAGELLGMSGGKYAEVRALVEKRADVSQRIAVLKACQRVEFEKVGEVLIASSEVGSFEAGAASALVELGADVAFVGCSCESGRISARVHNELSERVNAAELMKEIGAEFGGSGGGHAAAAGASGLKKEDVENALNECVRKAKERVEG
ncbi:DHH family phosphoesterase [Candidatus Micrarchaeota archaeon]|nr:DHH family phosphoesterase [Candidatus Micrarchaeota archaeon]